MRACASVASTGCASSIARSCRSSFRVTPMRRPWRSAAKPLSWWPPIIAEREFSVRSSLQSYRRARLESPTMYQVPQFREESLEVQHALIRENPLGLLISNSPHEVLANPIPFLLYEEGALGTLRCHLSRGNPQWQALRDRPEALVVFQGIDHYITPTWYPQKAIDHKVVPTWNYAMVQVRGRARIVEEPAWLLANVSA